MRASSGNQCKRLLSVDEHRVLHHTDKGRRIRRRRRRRRWTREPTATERVYAASARADRPRIDIRQHRNRKLVTRRGHRRRCLPLHAVQATRSLHRRLQCNTRLRIAMRADHTSLETMQHCVHGPIVENKLMTADCSARRTRGRGIRLARRRRPCTRTVREGSRHKICSERSGNASLGIRRIGGCHASELQTAIEHCGMNYPRIRLFRCH